MLKSSKLRFFILILLPLTINAQFVYKKVSSVLLSTIDKKSEFNAIKSENFKDAKDLTYYLPKKFSKIGDTDYTEFLQEGIDLNAKVILPNFPVLINFNGLKLRSNSAVLFQQNSQLILKPNGEELYGLIYIENISNVAVYFANLIGDRDQHLGNKGEWGMGFFIRDSQNVTLYNPKVTKMWGDGIYIGNVSQPSRNIEIKYAYVDENRRNGISIIAGEKINIANSIISNTYGTIPEYGIDIEPNKPEDCLNSVILSNNTTYNNKKGGLLFALDNLQGKQKTEIGIQVNNHTDYYSEKGIEFHIDRGYQKYTNPIKGTITINGANLFYNKIPLINNDSQQAQIKLNLIDVKKNNIKINNQIINNFIDNFQKGKLQTAQ